MGILLRPKLSIIYLNLTFFRNFSQKDLVVLYVIFDGLGIQMMPKTLMARTLVVLVPRHPAG